jgi:hypothetical protein
MPTTDIVAALATTRCFNQFGDVEQSPLRDGNVHSAKGWRAVLELGKATCKSVEPADNHKKSPKRLMVVLGQGSGIVLRITDLPIGAEGYRIVGSGPPQVGGSQENTD